MQNAFRQCRGVSPTPQRRSTTPQRWKVEYYPTLHQSLSCQPVGSDLPGCSAASTQALGWAFECGVDVIRSAHVSRSRRWQRAAGHRTERSLLDCFPPLPPPFLRGGGGEAIHQCPRGNARLQRVVPVFLTGPSAASRVSAVRSDPEYPCVFATMLDISLPVILESTFFRR